jgi:hypothetical protein
MCCRNIAEEEVEQVLLGVVDGGVVILKVVTLVDS